jgi:hypothetical protein
MEQLVRHTRLIGRIRPKVVTLDYLDRITDLVCSRYKRAITVDAPEGRRAVERYVEARALLREETQRFASQEQRGPKRLIDFLEETEHGSV